MLIPYDMSDSASNLTGQFIVWLTDCMGTHQNIIAPICTYPTRQNFDNETHPRSKGNNYFSHVLEWHYDDVIMTMLASQITSLPVVCSIVYSDVNQRKHQSSASLAFVREIHRGPVNFPHKWPVTRKMFPFDDVIMIEEKLHESVNTIVNVRNCKTCTKDSAKQFHSCYDKTWVDSRVIEIDPKEK